MGGLFKQLRKEKHLTQKEVADTLGITHATVSNWERGLNLPETPMAKKVAELYGVTVDELLKGERSEPIKEIEYVPSDRTKKFIRVPVLLKQLKILRTGRTTRYLTPFADVNTLD